MNCADCESRVCLDGTDCTGQAEQMHSAVKASGSGALLRAAATVEAEGYCKWPRVQELIAFGRQMGYRRIGIAFCVGLSDEARVLQELLSAHFEVESVCCKVGGLGKRAYGMATVREENETMCNPIGQATMLNEAGVELNVIMGLCMGHDIVFTEHARAPVTTLVVKDRVLAHNVVGALYCRYVRRRITAG